MVPAIQAPSRRNRFLVNSSFQSTKKLHRKATFALDEGLKLKLHVSASDGVCATPKPN